MTLSLYAGPTGAGQPTAPLGYGVAGFTQWNGGDWILPTDNDPPVPIVDQLETSLQLGVDFALDAGGNGGRLVASKTGLVLVEAAFTVIRPPSISLDARGIFSIAVGGVTFPASVQSKRFNIIDCDDVITLLAGVPVVATQTIGVVATSDASVLTAGLGIQLKGYTLAARYAQVL